MSESGRYRMVQLPLGHEVRRFEYPSAAWSLKVNTVRRRRRRIDDLGGALARQKDLDAPQVPQLLGGTWVDRSQRTSPSTNALVGASPIERATLDEARCWG